MRGCLLLLLITSTIQASSIVSIQLTGFKSIDNSNYLPGPIFFRACVTHLHENKKCDVAMEWVASNGYEFPPLWIYIDDSDYVKLGYELTVHSPQATNDISARPISFNASTHDIVHGKVPKTHANNFYARFSYEYYGALKGKLIPVNDCVPGTNLSKRSYPFLQVLDGRCDNDCLIWVGILSGCILIPIILTSLLCCCFCCGSKPRTHPGNATPVTGSGSPGWMYDQKMQITLPLERMSDSGSNIMTSFNSPSSRATAV